jgi:hypothetical protein
MGELERERVKVSQQVIDLSHDLAATLRERKQFKLKTISLEELRAKSRENWRAYRKELQLNPAKDKGRSLGEGDD